MTATLEAPRKYLIPLYANGVIDLDFTCATKDKPQIKAHKNKSMTDLVLFADFPIIFKPVRSIYFS